MHPHFSTLVTWKSGVDTPEYFFFVKFKEFNYKKFSYFTHNVTHIFNYKYKGDTGQIRTEEKKKIRMYRYQQVPAGNTDSVFHFPYNKL